MADFRMGLLEQKLVEHFATGGTAQEAADEYGISAVEAYQRVKDALNKADVWTMIELSKMNVIILQKMLRQAQQAFNPSDPKSVDANAKLVQAIEKLQKTQFTLTDDDLERAALANANKLRVMIQHAYNKARAMLVLEYPNAPVNKLDEAFRVGLLEAAKDADLAE